MQAAAAAPSRVDSIIAAHTTANNALNANATKVKAHVTITAEALSALTLAQAVVASDSRVDNIMVAE